MVIIMFNKVKTNEKIIENSSLITSPISLYVS